MRTRTRHGGDALAGRLEQLEELHRGQDDVELAPQFEAARVADDGSRADVAGRGALAQLRRQPWIEVETCNAVPGRRQIEGHAPGAAAEIEHATRAIRSGGARGEVAPKAEVGAVGAALEVVPDDRRDLRGQRAQRVHSQNGAAWPRAASSSRRSSRAV